MEEDAVFESTEAPVEPTGVAPFRRILVPVDFGDESREAVAVALALRARFGGEMALFTLAEYGQNDEFLRGLGDEEGIGKLVRASEDRLRRFLENVAPDAAGIGSVACLAFVENDLADATERAVQSWGPTVVVLGWHPKKRWFSDPLHQLIDSLDVPVFLLRPAEPAPAAAPD